jgi:hypothetical protein
MITCQDSPKKTAKKQRLFAALKGEKKAHNKRQKA